VSQNRTPLPSARLVSTEVHDDISVPHQRYTLLLMQYAQLLDHDLTHTPMNRGESPSVFNLHFMSSSSVNTYNMYVIICESSWLSLVLLKTFSPCMHSNRWCIIFIIIFIASKLLATEKLRKKRGKGREIVRNCFYVNGFFFSLDCGRF
jgi:hypothetical protein